ncbi:MAG: hypothetical protein H6615_07015 [Ignavibacteria bacterium]|nr:hypothetical protein [Ignavibacteria bacterium]
MNKIQKSITNKIEDIAKSNKNDRFASAIKSTVGELPFVGSYIADIITDKIPNQKLDRVIAYLGKLTERLNELPKENIEELIASPKFQALLEETIEQSAKATTQERYEYLASIVVNGISDEKVAVEESEYILSLFKQLTDVQIIWLNYYCLKRYGNSNEYFEKHKNILKKKEVYLKASFEDITQVALQRGNTEHLIRLGLIREENDYDRKTEQLKIDSSTKKLKVTDTVITDLGKVVLSHIGIFEDYNKSAN